MITGRHQILLVRAWIERYFPCPFERGGPVLVILGVSSAILYLYTSTWNRDSFRHLPENMMILTFFISAWGQRHQLKSDLIVRLMILSLLIPLCLFLVNLLIDYEAALKYRSLNDLLKLFMFLALAWWMGGSWKGARRMMIIAFLGLLTAILLDPNLTQSLNRLLAGGRVDFNIHNAQHGAFLFGLVIIYSLCSLSLKSDETHSLRTNIVLFLACLIGVMGVLGTQTRATFIGLFACGFIGILQWVRQSVFSRGRTSPVKIFFFLFFFAVLVVGTGTEIKDGRFASAKSQIQTLLEGSLEKLPVSGGVGIRVHSWAESLKWIAKRPIIGWGRGARSDVIKHAEHFPDEIKRLFGHLHNGYLELLLGLGVIGLAFLGIFWAVLLKKIKLAASEDLYAFALYGSIFLFVLNLFESMFFYWSGVLGMSLFMAGGYSQYLAKNMAGAPRPAVGATRLSE